MPTITTVLRVLACAGLASVLTSCGGGGNDDSAVVQKISEQNQKLDEHERILIEQGEQIQKLSEQLDVMQHLLEKQIASSAVVTPAIDTNTNARREAIRQLVGFNARLSAGLGYPAYADELGDLDSSLAQQLIEIDDQNFSDAVKQVLKQYDLASDLWDKFVRSGSDTYYPTPSERYNYSLGGINFVDDAPLHLTDVHKFWRLAYEQTQKLIEMDKDLSSDDATAKN
jgi:hypothetical protein